MPNGSKKANKRVARKRALRIKHGIKDGMATRDSIRAARRHYGGGKGK